MGQFASNLGNSNVMDPRQAKWGDLDNSEKGARVLGGAARGLGSGLQAYGGQMPQSGGIPQINPMQFGQQPNVQLPGMNPSQMNDPFARQLRGNNLAFYGGQ